MSIGHFAVGFAIKRVAPRASLGVLMGAALLLDLLWAAFLLAGLEYGRVDPGNTAATPLAFVGYPISHSILMTIALAVIAARVCWAVTRYTRGAAVVALAVISH